MIKTWLILCLIANSLLAQDPLPTELPDDLAAAVAAMPITGAVTAGQAMHVIDGLTQQPIRNADVIFISDARSDAYQTRSRELRTKFSKQKITSKKSGLLILAMLGTRYQTNAEGIVRVPSGKDAFAVIIAGDRSGRWRSGTGDTVKLFAPGLVKVQVRNSRGTPARNVPVAIGSKDRFFFPSAHATTDASGACELEIVPNLIGKEVCVRALIASNDLVETTFSTSPIPKQPVQLQLPPCGTVRFILYGEDERPSKDLRKATLHYTRIKSKTSPIDRFLSPTASLTPSSIEPDGAMFEHVEIGMDVSISATVQGIRDALKFKAAGPARESELIIVDGRINIGPPIVSLRLLDQQGKPVADEKIGITFHSAKSHKNTLATTDALGTFTVAFPKLLPESLYVVRRKSGELTSYLGAARLTVTKLKPGKQDLGDLRLVDEPVLAAGRVVDDEGQPVAGVWLRGRTGLLSSSAIGTPKSTDPWFFEHRVQTDKDGRFELRERKPVDRPMRLHIDSRQWVAPDRLTIEAGDTDATLRITRAAQIEGELLGNLKGLNLAVNAIHRDTGKKTRGRITDGKFLFDRLPAGSYDLKFGPFGQFVIESVTAASSGEPQDPRLRTCEWSKHFQLLTTTVTDEQGMPLEDVAVEYTATRGNSRSGTYARTDKSGVARQLMPSKDSSIEIRQPGYERQQFSRDLQDLKIQLLPIAPINVQILGMPKMPEGVLVQADVESENDPRKHSHRSTMLRGRAIVYPPVIGQCTMTITLRPDYSVPISNKARQALETALRIPPIEFQVLGTRTPTKAKTFTLDQTVLDDLAACLKNVRAALKQKN